MVFHCFENNNLTLFGYACGLGGQNEGAVDGPITLKKRLSQSIDDIELSWGTILSAPNNSLTLNSSTAMSEISKLAAELASVVGRSLDRNEFPVVIGGDHSCAAGTWSAVSSHLNGDLGLIWIDAHMDSHTPETSPNGWVHGMPLAALLGLGDESLVSIVDVRKKLKPENLCLIGVRDYEPEERLLLERLKVKVFYSEHVEKKGIHNVLSEALAHVTDGTSKFGVSIDLDGFKPNHAPGVGTPSPGGIDSEEFLDAFSTVVGHPSLVAAEIAEYNPHEDLHDKTYLLIKSLLESLMQVHSDLEVTS